MTIYDWILVGAVWSLIPLVLFLKRRQDRRDASSDRISQQAIDRILTEQGKR